MTAQIQLGDMTVAVVRKDIKNVHLSVHPPTGRVTIAAPAHMGLDTIRVFAITKLAWIRQQQAKLQEQEREAPREFLDRESHYVWGKRYLLKVIEIDQAPAIELKHSKMLLHVRPGAGQTKCQTIMDEWYRQQLRLRPVSVWETRSSSPCTAAARVASHLSSTTRVLISSSVSWQYLAATLVMRVSCAALSLEE